MILFLHVITQVYTVLSIGTATYTGTLHFIKLGIEYFWISQQIDILVNNGARSQRGMVVNTDFKVDQELIELNVIGTISLTKVVLPHMIKRNAGHIVVVSSIAGKIGTPIILYLITLICNNSTLFTILKSFFVILQILN